MFFKKEKELSIFKDAVFAVSSLAKEDNDENKVNATIGSLCGEDGKIVAFKSVYDRFNKISNGDKTSYAKSPIGNPDYREAISSFVLEDKIKGQAVATAGGTGAIALALDLCLEKNETVILPDVAWGNYKQMLRERNLEALTYDIYNLDDLLSKINSVERAFVIINSPCENPCGLSYSYEEWEKIIEALGKKKEAILLNDVAYIDYAYNEKYKDYFKLFNDLDKNVLALIAYSCSKTFSYYGQRLGALIIVNKDKEFVDLFANQCEKHIRTTYGSCNNAGMIAISDVLNNNLEEFLKEKNYYKDLLKKRSELFIKECKENNIDLYPYNEGFFVTIKCLDNDLRDKIHSKLIENHIYCVKMNKGIRVGICSVPLEKIKGLAKRIKAVLDNIK